MAYSNQLTYAPLKSFSSASLSGTYQAVGTPLAFPAAILRIVNNGTTAVTISIDGVNDHDVVLNATSAQYTLSELIPATLNMGLRSGTQFYIKGTAGTGTIYIVYLYQVTA